MLDSSDEGSGDSVDWDHDAIDQEYDTDDDEIKIKKIWTIVIARVKI